MSANPRAGSIFTRNDLEMAYAFRQQMSGSGATQGVGGVVSRHGNQGARQSGWEGSFAQQQQGGGGRRGGYFLPSSLTQSTINQHGYSSISPSPSDLATIQQTPHQRQVGGGSSGGGGYRESMQLLAGRQRQSVASSSGQYVPLGERLAARRAGGYVP